MVNRARIVVFLWVFLLVAVVLEVGCRARPATAKVPSGRHVVIGGFSGSLEQARTLTQTMRQAGVDVFFDGSIVYDILVRENQAALARTLLSTNQLTLSGKVQIFSADGKAR